MERVVSPYVPFAIPPGWQRALQGELSKPYLWQLAAFVAEARVAKKRVFPPDGLVCNALAHTPFDRVRVVIMGQDPYHGVGQAHGLSFSVPYGVPPPPSLKNMFKELADDLGLPIPDHGCLISWADQGVLLLNATLTVCEGEPLSHHNRGWEQFTDAVIRALALRKEPVIFLLWGKNALEKCGRVPELAKNPQHQVLTAAHPSPLAAHSGFFGCRHFSKTNQLLISRGEPPIDWSLPALHQPSGST